MNAPAKTVDSHQHVCWHQRDAAGLIADLDAHGIAYAWLLTWLLAASEDASDYRGVFDPARFNADGSHPGLTLDAILRARDRYPGRFVVGYCPNPQWKDAPKLLESAHAMHGAQVCGEWKFQMLIDDPRALEIFHTAGRLRLPVVLHLDVPYLRTAEGRSVYQPRWQGGTVENLERALHACPETVFIGHAPGFWREISGDAAADPETYPRTPVRPGGRLERLLADWPNLYADLSAGSGLSALRRDPAHAAGFLTRFADRLLFGRDYYGGELAEFLKTVPLSADVVEKIHHQNAERLVTPKFRS